MWLYCCVVDFRTTTLMLCDWTLLPSFSVLCRPALSQVADLIAITRRGKEVSAADHQTWLVPLLLWNVSVYLCHFLPPSLSLLLLPCNHFSPYCNCVCCLSLCLSVCPVLHVHMSWWVIAGLSVTLATTYRAGWQFCALLLQWGSL